ncbi:MAG: DUF2007 domain-containing protein [Anaerolineae bacterium]|nr:DUF2007 domain-containing protein [Anaerolineae bacterium]
MSDFESTALPLPSQENSGSPDGSQEVHWKVVAQAPGITPATIIAGRLQAEGVPVRVWQEAAGQALGLTVGLLGTGHVLVPEEYVEQALEILAYEADPLEEAEAFEEFDDLAWDDEI